MKKRRVIDLTATDQFYRAAFTTLISRVRFNRELQAKKKHHISLAFSF